ncbi:MAG: DUF3293 domain-containing protein [Pseudomonadota bacterium]
MREKLERAYVETDYVVCTHPAPLLLRIGQRCADLSGLYDQHGSRRGVLVTGWNPGSRLSSADDNRRANERLKTALVGRSPVVFAAEGRGRRGDWPPEASFFALGWSRRASRDLGARFAQNAVVWVGPAQIPELLWCRGDAPRAVSPDVEKRR